MKAEIGIFGGSGLYEFFSKGKPASRRRATASRGGWITVKTPYGGPSDKIFLTEYPPSGEAGNNKKLAFLPRHGRKHQIPPHKINYRANVWAFKKLGVKAIISPSAVGSLQSNIKRGDFVICDEFIDRTRNRKDTFFNKNKVVHISSADAYCEKLRKIAIKVCKKHKIRVHPSGTAVVIQGPRFSSRAESKWFTKMGWDVVNMTQYPEAVLAREAEICYLSISIVTDYDIGLVGRKGIEPVSIGEVIRVFNKNIEKVKKVILDIIKEIPRDHSCKQCHQALKGAEV